MSEADPRLGTIVAGYRLTDRLGAGGMGVVYGAVRIEGGASVAVKLLHEPFAQVPDLVRRFEREAEAMRLVAHPNLVAIFDAGLFEGVPYLVMERLVGKSLSALLEEARRQYETAVRVRAFATLAQFV